MKIRPFIVVTAWFPLNKSTEAAEKYIEERKAFPPDKSLVKELVANAIKVDSIKNVFFNKAGNIF
ncbi:MAG: hypothetical protein ACFFCV_21225 [Promethearchaeota archaeon]